jgi:hypothetical protein
MEFGEFGVSGVIVPFLVVVQKTAELVCVIILRQLMEALNVLLTDLPA